MRWSRFGVLAALLVGVSGVGGQVIPEVPDLDLEVVVELRTARIEPGTTTRVVIEDVSSRLATEAELEAAALGDVDGNGVSDLLQACSGGLAPIEAACQAHGAPSGEVLMEWFLAENAAKGLYSQERALAVAESAGFPPEQVDDWRERYLEPPPEPGCRACLDQVLAECEGACEGIQGNKRRACVLKCKARRKQQCKQVCKEERKALQDELQGIKREIKLGLKEAGRPPRAKPKGDEPDAIAQLYQAFAGLWAKLRSLKGWR